MKIQNLLLTTICIIWFLSCSTGSIKNESHFPDSKKKNEIFFHEDFSKSETTLCISDPDITISNGKLTIPAVTYDKRYISFKITPSCSPILSLKYKTDISPHAYFKISVISSDSSENILALIPGTNTLTTSWKNGEYMLTSSSDEIEIRISVTNDTGYYSNKTNSVQIDDLFVIQNSISSIEIAYSQYISISGELPDITFKRGDNLSFAANILESVEYFIINESGNPEQITSTCDLSSGIYHLYATYGGHIKSNTIKMIIPSTDNLYYQGIFYKGHVPDLNSEPVSDNPESDIHLITLFNSSNTSDGFFKIRIKNNSTDIKKRCVLLLVSSPSGKTDRYYLYDNTDQHVFLRYGIGDYKISIHDMTIKKESIYGSIMSCSYNYFPSEYSFIIKNTANLKSELMPGPDIDSSDYRIQNLTFKSIYSNSPISEKEKIRRISETLVMLINYDHESLIEINHRPQSARDIMNQIEKSGSAAALCAGYTSLCVAALRAVSIPALSISGVAYTGSSKSSDQTSPASLRTSGPHAWVNVILDNKPLLLDVCWMDSEDNSISYDYFLIDSLDGINRDHLSKKEADE